MNRAEIVAALRGLTHKQFVELFHSLSLRYVSGKKTDEFGNVYRYWSYAIADNDLDDPRPLRRRVVDVLLRFVPAGSLPGPTTTSTSSVRVL